MNTEIWIAIITSIASLLIAIVSLINSIVSNRHSTRSTRMIENLKFEIEEKKITQNMRDKYLQQSLESLDILIQAIQRVKDVTYVILNDTDSSLDSGSVIKMVSEARKEFFDCFEQQLPNLQEDEAKSAHSVKNKAFAIETMIRQSIHGKSFASELSDSQKQNLLELRNDLTDMQNLLRDIKATQLSKRLKLI